MKKLLLPTDFSEHASNALDLVRQFAEMSSETIQLVLLHVINPERFIKVGEDGTYLDASKDENYCQVLKNNAQEQIEETQKAHPSLDIQGFVENGDVTELIQRYADEQAVDLVVIGSKVHHIYEEMLFGSSTDRIIRNVKTPVLTVRSKVEGASFKNLVLASDLKDENNPVFAQLKSMQALFGAQIHLVYINTPGSFYNTRRIREMKDTFLSKHPLENYTFHIYDDFTIETGIAHFCEDVRADIVALGAHHMGNLLEYTHHSHTADVLIDELSRPVLTFSL